MSIYSQYIEKPNEIIKEGIPTNTNFIEHLTRVQSLMSRKDRKKTSLTGRFLAPLHNRVRECFRIPIGAEGF